MNQNKSIAGPLMVLLSASCFAGGGLAMKFITWSPLAINGCRTLLGTCVVGLYLLVKKHKLKINLPVLLGALCIVGEGTLFTTANKLTTAGNAIILQFTAPVWIMLFSFLFFRKLPKRREIIMTIAVTAGILCFFMDSLGNGNFTGDLFALGSGVLYSVVFMLNEFEHGDSLSSLFFGFLISAVTMGPQVLKETDFSAPVLIAILFLGFVQQGIAFILLLESTRLTPPVTASLISGIEPILNPVLVAIFWGEVLAPMSLVGAAIVLVAIAIYNVLNIKS